MKPGERRWFPDSGVIRKGKWDNLPGGEIFTTPDEEHVDGVLVLPVLHDDVTPEQGVDEYVRLTIHHGRIVRIDGGASAEKLRQYFLTNAEAAEHPLSVLQCSEIAFGANLKARTGDPTKAFSEPGHSAVETEKRLGTMHIAFGDAQHGEEGTEGHTHAPTHLDFVLPRAGLTVRAFRRFEDYEQARSFRTEKEGETLIRNGDWQLLS